MRTTDFLPRWVRIERLDPMLEQGHMRALAISGSSYTSGQHVTFYQSAQEVEPWLRSQRLAVPATIFLPVAAATIP